MNSSPSKKARAVGINHIALEVADIEAALEFFGSLFELKLRGRHDNMAFIDLGDQFINLSAGRSQGPDTARHFGLVVDDREAVRRAVEATGVKILPSQGLDFLDPWGNHVQVVEYQGIQFTKAPHILRGMAMEGLGKTQEALSELAQKGMVP
ncbi:extradiol dioxygenase [Geoalkalibacter ferrihydriticus DSM 17813]|uniref:Extradiol dioxygenase n=1 Tax=Geoalkalibacter ferrihydriticus DSM 17813 TaxID=1121915 RepID=A0A0C2DUZ2_9BACT|nr:VOC family protein [Geoalkalibacter ferrihydriticus]KIH77244.1 extradiol dioxygenase [Geoalkalibacter ferrihydriticus DSM 17813]